MNLIQIIKSLTSKLDDATKWGCKDLETASGTQYTVWIVLLKAYRLSRSMSERANENTFPLMTGLLLRDQRRRPHPLRTRGEFKFLLQHGNYIINLPCLHRITKRTMLASFKGKAKLWKHVMGQCPLKCPSDIMVIMHIASRDPGPTVLLLCTTRFLTINDNRTGIASRFLRCFKNSVIRSRCSKRMYKYIRFLGSAVLRSW